MRTLALAVALCLAGAARADEAGYRSTQAVADTASPAQAQTEEKVETAPSYAPLHLSAEFLADPIWKHVGAEVGGSWSMNPIVDLGLSAVLGSSVGGRLLVNLHSPLNGGLRPFAQVRGIVHPVPDGFAFGIGALLGGTYELGPGRAVAGLMGELYKGPPSYPAFAALASLGYEFDLLRPPESKTPAMVETKSKTATDAPQVKVPVVMVTPPPPVVTPPAAQFGTVRGRVTDLDDKPLQATINLPGAAGDLGSRPYDASPEYELRLPPGEYRLEARADGFLVRGRTVTVKAGESILYDFTLRPVPKVATAQLTDQRIEIKQTIQFAADGTRILPESFPVLDEIVDILMRNPKLKLRLEGHSDNAGTAAKQLQDSENRAYTVLEYLIDKGIAQERLIAKGFGGAKPVASNKTEQGRAKNRRVQFEIIER